MVPFAEDFRFAGELGYRFCRTHSDIELISVPLLLNKETQQQARAGQEQFFYVLPKIY